MQEGDIMNRTFEFKITGTLRNGKRFSPIFTKTPWQYNIWNGTVWEKVDNKWKVVERINNGCSDRFY